jgi:hypothetical protein
MSEKSTILVLLMLISSMLMVAMPIVRVSASPSGLVYDASYNAHSTTAVTTTSTSLIDDTQASSVFTLASARIVLVIYSACNYHTAIEVFAGKKMGIDVDGSDVATIQSSPFSDGYANGGVVIWVGTLAAGSHTIKGRFASNFEGYTVTINERRLTVAVFEGAAEDFRFVRSTTAVTTASTSLVDDTQASFTFITSLSCKALILYSACNYNETTESTSGKMIAISTDGSDGLALGSSPYYPKYADSEFVAEIRSLTSGSHTIKGRFFSIDGSTVTISERQFAVLLFSSDLETDFVASSTQVSVTGSTLSDDTQASVTRTIDAERYVLAVYCAGKRNATSSTMYGKKVAVKIDVTDYGLNAQSPYGDNYANTIAIQSDIVGLGDGTHTVIGRFASNDVAETAKVDDRQLCVLWWRARASIPVGGVILPANEIQLLIPYAALAAAAAAAIVAAKAAMRKRTLKQ